MEDEYEVISIPMTREEVQRGEAFCATFGMTLEQTIIAYLRNVIKYEKETDERWSRGENFDNLLKEIADRTILELREVYAKGKTQ